MMIAWNRVFVTRKAVEARGRFRVRQLPDGQEVRLLRRIGRELYVAEPLPKLAFANAFADWAVKSQMQLSPLFSSKIGKVHVGTDCVGKPCTNPVHFHIHGSEVTKIIYPWTKPDA
jgi:hypothetical protein